MRSFKTTVTFFVLLLLCPIQSLDPYAILNVPQSACQDDIRRSYRSLCLRFHPDKNVNRSPKERQQCEETFKEIQKAYSLVGNPESRKNYDLLSRYGTPYGSSFQQTQRGQPSQFYSSNRQRFSSVDELFHNFFRQQQGFSFGAPSFRASTPPDFFNLSRFKCVYVQNVPVSLEDLFTGKSGFEFSLKGSLWQRLTAAFRGGLGLVLLYQSFLFTLPMIRFSKLASLVLGLCLFQSHIPEPSQTNFYADLKAGYKQGTKFTFTEERFDAVFILKELQHPHFVRQGNDLYTTIYITPRQARRGATVRTNHLDKSPLVIRVPRGCKTGSLIRLAQQGWPDRRRKCRGDLFVQVRIRQRARRWAYY